MRRLRSNLRRSRLAARECLNSRRKKVDRSNTRVSRLFASPSTSLRTFRRSTCYSKKLPRCRSQEIVLVVATGGPAGMAGNCAATVQFQPTRDHHREREFQRLPRKSERFAAVNNTRTKRRRTRLALAIANRITPSAFTSKEDLESIFEARPRRSNAVCPFAIPFAHRNLRVGHMGIEFPGGQVHTTDHRLTKRFRALPLTCPRRIRDLAVTEKIYSKLPQL